MTHNTREVEEGVDAVFQAVMSDLNEKYRVSDTLSDVLTDSLSKHLTDAITTLYQEVDQELQKAREEERERLSIAVRSAIAGIYPKPDVPEELLGDYEKGVIEGASLVKKWVIQELDHFELDQDKV